MASVVADGEERMMNDEVVVVGQRENSFAFRSLFMLIYPVYSSVISSLSIENIKSLSNCDSYRKWGIANNNFSSRIPKIPVIQL